MAAPLVGARNGNVAGMKCSIAANVASVTNMKIKCKGLVWLQSNLRLQHNQSIADAAAQCRALAFVYILPDVWFQKGAFGIERIGKHRLRFLLDSLSDLAQSLQEQGHTLVFRRGEPVQILLDLVKEYNFDALFAQRIWAWEEQQQVLRLQNELPVPLYLSDDNHLYKPEELPFALSDLPAQFTQFRNLVEKRPLKARPGYEPDLKQLEPVGMKSDDFPELTIAAHAWMQGGEQAGLKHLKEYLDSGEVRHYKETRNGMLEKSESSKLSAWLALGCLNAHTVLMQLQAHEMKHGPNDSTYWLWFELLWRDYFRLVSARFGKAIFLKGGIKGLANDKPFRKPIFERFCTGKTQEDFVNANMQELAQTGWMSNRGRQNVASFWVHDLGMDWRAGAAWFEYSLIDYDVHSNYGNWMYVAGVGNDPRPNRKFNISKQASQYDPEGSYVRKWLGKAY